MSLFVGALHRNVSRYQGPVPVGLWVVRRWRGTWKTVWAETRQKPTASKSQGPLCYNHKEIDTATLTQTWKKTVQETTWCQLYDPKKYTETGKFLGFLVATFVVCWESKKMICSHLAMQNVLETSLCQEVRRLPI